MFGWFKKKFDVEAYIAGSLEGLKLVTEAHQSGWRFGQESSWRVDQDHGLIEFAFADGMVATAPVQIIGTYNTQESSFMWGWDHPSVQPALQRNAEKVLEFACEHGVKELTNKLVGCTEQRAWEYTALAMRLADFNGAYRAEAAPGTYVFMNFGPVQLARAA